MSARGDNMAGNAIKIEPVDEVEVKPDVDAVWILPSSVKEEIAIEPAVIQPVEQKFALRQYTRKPVKQEPLQISRADTLHIDKNEPEPGSSREHRCTICNDNFHLQSALDIHIAECHALSLCCKFCENIYAVKKETQTYSCEYCNKIFSNVLCMERHQRIEHGRSGLKPHKCEICNKSFQHKISLIRHERNLHAAFKPHKCEICNKSFQHEMSLIRHTRNLHNDSASKKFLRQRNIQSQHPENNGSHYCSICNRTLSQKSDLYVHMLRHARIKPHFCNICKQAFAKMNHLRMHQVFSKHIDESVRYRCNVCGQASFTSDRIIEHMRTHIGEKPIYCDLCEKKFLNNGILEFHILSKHSKRMSAHGDDMKADAIKVEPTDEVEEKPDVHSVWLPASSVKEEIDIGSTATEPVDQKFALRQYKKKSV